MFKRIYGQAMSRRDAAAHFDSKGPQLVKHLIKLYMYPNSDSVNHWKNEVLEFCSESVYLKGHKSFPKSSMIYEELWGKRRHMISRLVQHVKFREADLKPRSNYSEVDLLTRIDDYINWVSIELSKNEFLDLDEGCSRLDEFLK